MAIIFPTNKNHAIEKNIPLYYVSEPCNVCNAYAHKRYVTDDKCKSCITKEATATIIMMKCLEGENDHVSWETQEIWVSPNVTKCAKPWKLPDDVWERVIETAMMLNDDPSLTPTFEACERHSHIKIKTPTGACYYCQQMAKNSPRKIAQRDNQPTYISTKKCTTCDSTERHTKTSECVICHPIRSHADGLSPRQEAQRDNQPTYISTKKCHSCRGMERRTKTSACITCHPIRSHADGLSPRQEAIRNGERWYTPNKPCEKCNTLSDRSVANGYCKGCAGTPKKSPRQQALSNKDLTYMSERECKVCGSYERVAKTSQCTTCKPLRTHKKGLSPRQEAIKNGDEWYMPNKPCKKCGTISLKRVNNGACKGC